MLRAIGERGPSPRFLFAHTYVAHNYLPSEENLRAVGAGDAEVERLRERILSQPLEARIRRVEGEFGRNPENARLLRLLYDASVRHADRLVGAICERIDRERAWGRTVLVVTSDHGEELGERGNVGHGHSLFEELIRVPLLMAVPGVGPRRISDVVSLADVAPTLRSLCGLPPDPRVDGRDLAPLLHGESLAERSVLAGAPFGPVLHAIRGSRFKLIVGEGGAELLYDLRADPKELRNLASSEEQKRQEMRDALERRLRRLRERAGDAGEAALDAATRDELRELGYLGGG